MTQDPIYPLTFEPAFRPYIWGGRNLETLFGRVLPPGIVAESWEISGHPSSPTKVNAGTLAGLTLPQIQEILGPRLVGTRSEWATDRGKFPLLVKLLDANRPLSVQVHPPDPYALANEGGELGKTEMWVVLHAKPGAEIVYGLSKETNRESFQRALQEGTLSDLLYRQAVKQGDAIFVPTGTLHALLAGVVVAEIQQNSDTTYRVYDWERVGQDGKPRPLHIDKALDVINFDMVQPKVCKPLVVDSGDGVHRAELSRCPYFVVEEIRLETGASYSGLCDGSTFQIWGCISGHAEIGWEGEALPLCAVQFALLPAALGGFSLHANQPATLLRVYAPSG